MEYLSAEDIAGLQPDAATPVRDWGLLDLAAHRPASGFGEVGAFPGIFEKAACLLDAVVRLHPFLDGNKRAGWLAAAVFLLLNSQLLEADEDDAFATVIAVATREIEVPELAEWLEARCRQVE